MVPGYFGCLGQIIYASVVVHAVAKAVVATAMTVAVGDGCTGRSDSFRNNQPLARSVVVPLTTGCGV